MPIYEYKCDNCGHVYEEIRHVKDSDKAINCLKCLKGKLVRIMSRFRETYKGSGFHKNDYA